MRLERSGARRLTTTTTLTIASTPFHPFQLPTARGNGPTATLFAHDYASQPGLHGRPRPPPAPTSQIPAHISPARCFTRAPLSAPIDDLHRSAALTRLSPAIVPRQTPADAYVTIYTHLYRLSDTIAHDPAYNDHRTCLLAQTLLLTRNNQASHFKLSANTNRNSSSTKNFLPRTHVPPFSIATSHYGPATPRWRAHHHGRKEQRGW